MWRVGSSKQIEVQFAHKFWLEVASNSIALWFLQEIDLEDIDLVPKIKSHHLGQMSKPTSQ